MATEADLFRQRAEEQRNEADRATLPNVRARALHAAERWGTMAEHAERSTAASTERNADKAVRDAARALRT